MRKYLSLTSNLAWKTATPHRGTPKHAVKNAHACQDGIAKYSKKLDKKYI